MKRLIILLLLGLAGTSPVLALYDPKPAAPLERFEGDWTGQLTYRDYQEPHRDVTLPTRMIAALIEPGRLALHYIYDDGPRKDGPGKDGTKKIVHSCEALTIDLSNKTASWGETSGKPPTSFEVTRVDDVGAGHITLVLASWMPAFAGTTKYRPGRATRL